MLNLPEITVPAQVFGNKPVEEPRRRQSMVLYQTGACFRMLEEALLFEGMEAPQGQKCTDDGLADQVTAANSAFLFAECSGDVVEKAVSLKHLVSRERTVILIGREDKMSTAREVEKLGFYYLYWPAKKDDILSLLHHINDDVNRSHSVNHARAAMRIGVVGLKGGSGCTMIAGELAYSLSRESQQQVILVDHGYKGSNMHIMLGKRDLARRKMTDTAVSHHSLTNTLDHMTAQSQLTELDPNIRYLGLESDTLTPVELYEYNNRLLLALSYDANFIIEDYSASVKIYPDPREICDLVDCIVMVVQPSLSGLHESKIFLQQFMEVNPEMKSPARHIIVLNHNVVSHRINRKAVEEYLDQPVDIEIPYYRKAEEYLTTGKRFIDGNARQATPFRQLSRKIIGKPLVEESLLKKLFWAS